MRSLTVLLTVIGVAGCATVAMHELDQRYGQPDPKRFDVPVHPVAGMSYRNDVQPILDRRCVVCHGCYDAPCQLKLGAWEGVTRGASLEPVYKRQPPVRGADYAPVRRCTVAFAVAAARFFAGAE